MPVLYLPSVSGDEEPEVVETKTKSVEPLVHDLKGRSAKLIQDNTRLRCENLQLVATVRHLAQFVINKLELGARWPCPDCGREGPQEPFRSVTLLDIHNLRITAGCMRCVDGDALLREARKVLRQPVCGSCKHWTPPKPPREGQCFVAEKPLVPHTEEICDKYEELDWVSIMRKG